MVFGFVRISIAAVLVAIALTAQGAKAATEDLGGGFLHHGVATPVSNHRGTVATVDGEGRNVVLVWLFDLRGGYTGQPTSITSGAYDAGGKDRAVDPVCL